MRVLILDEDTKRGGDTARELNASGQDVAAEAAPSSEGLRRLERGEWFDLVVAEPPASQNPPSDLLRRYRGLAGAPPLLCVAPEGEAAVPPPGVAGLVPREAGYQQRLPHLARQALRLHRLTIRNRELEARLQSSHHQTRIGWERSREKARQARDGLHRLLHELHSRKAGADSAGADGLDALIETAEEAWERLDDLAQTLETASDPETQEGPRILTTHELVRRALALALEEPEAGLVSVASRGRGRLFVDPGLLSPPLSEALSFSLARQESPHTLELYHDAGSLELELPWAPDTPAPERLSDAVLLHEGSLERAGARLKLRLPLVREEELASVLVQESLERAVEQDRPFTLMKIEGGAAGPLAPDQARRVVKSTDQVLGTSEGGLLFLLNGLCEDNAWSVATRVRKGLETNGGLLPFRTLTFPSQASSPADFLRQARAQGLLPAASAGGEHPGLA